MTLSWIAPQPPCGLYSSTLWSTLALQGTSPCIPSAEEGLRGTFCHDNPWNPPCSEDVGKVPLLRVFTCQTRLLPLRTYSYPAARQAIYKLVPNFFDGLWPAW